MSLAIVPALPHHVQSLQLQPMQAVAAIVRPVDITALRSAGDCYSLVDSAGDAHAICGVIKQWEGRALAWAMLGWDVGPHMLRLTRAARRFLDGCAYRRIEAHVDATSPEAIRWIEMLGFQRETPEPMGDFFPNGRGGYLYSRRKPCLTP